VIVVSGGAGNIGSHLVERLLADGEKVRVLDIQPWKYGSHPNLDVIQCDIRGPLPSFFGVERVFHLAALADIVPSIDNPIEYYDTNVTGTLNVLEKCRQDGVKKFIYAASSSCYGMNGGTTGVIEPQYPYALTKYMGEQLAMHWSKIYGLDVTSLRLFNVYGPRSRTTGAYGAVFGVFLAQIANSKPLTVVGDGTQRRDFTYVTDVVNGIIMGAQYPGIYEVGTGNPVSVNDIVGALGGPQKVYIPKRPGEPDLTISMGEKPPGWHPSVSISEGVRLMLNNLHCYKDAPVWTPETVEVATKTWFERLSA